MAAVAPHGTTPCTRGLTGTRGTAKSTRRARVGQMPVSAPLRARMEAVVDLAESRFENVRVDLRRREIGVAEHRLNRAEIGATLEQMRRERMPQYVRTEAAADAGAATASLENLPEAETRQPGAAARVDEHPGTGFLAEQHRPCLGDVLLHPLHRRVADRHDALLAALANALQKPLVRAQVGQAQADELRYPQAGRVEHFNQRAIAQALRRRHVGGLEQRVDAVERFELAFARGRKRRELRQITPVGFDRVGGHAALDLDVPQVAHDRHGEPRLGAGRLRSERHESHENTIGRNSQEFPIEIAVATLSEYP